jgi:4-hydroxy-3-methylbut-2-enyl diphosphate reductase
VKVGITAGASTPDGIIKEVKTFMAESTKTNGDAPEIEQSFEEMLNESFVTLNRGERVKGIVSHISGSEIYVDLGGKYTGVLSFDEITDDMSADVREMFKVGDEIETQIMKTNDQEGTALLSRKRIDSSDNWDKIVKHSEDGTTAEGKVIHVVNGGIIILVESVKLFVPASHANVSKDTDLQTLVNKQVKVKIIDVNQQKRRAIASIRNAEKEERWAMGEKVWAELELGKKYEGVVKSIANYGAFVDIGGVDGMVHITELSWTRIKHPSEVLKIGDTIQVYIKNFDTEKRRIALGYKDESENPWTKFVAAYKVNDLVDVKISNMMPFGAFAEIMPGVDGLIHISEITDKRISKPAEILNIGDMVKAKITRIDSSEGKNQVGLSIIAAEEAEEAAIVEEAGVEAIDDAESTESVENAES